MASRVRETSSAVAQLALDGKAKELQGIGKTIEEKIVQIVEQGEIEALAKRKAAIPAEVVLFMRLPGLGAKTEEKILKALAFQADNPDEGRRLLGEGLPAVQAAVAVLREHPSAAA